MLKATESIRLINSLKSETGEEKIRQSLSEEKGEQKFSFSRTSKQEKVLLISMALMNFFAATCFSLLAPFFPAEAARKGVSTTVTGFIFGVFEFVIFLTSPIFGNYITRIGSKFMFTSGFFVCGSCAILFGLLDRSPDGTSYIVLCFCSRTVEALGTSAYVTALFAIIANVFPNNVSTVVGALETFSGIGMMVGPALGGALYTAGGFGLPFFVMGSVVIVYGMICLYLMPPVQDKHSKLSKSFVYLLRSPLALITGVSIVINAFSLGFLDPTLANHLAELGLNTWQIGLMFLICPGVYACTAPFWGFLSDSKGYIKSLIFLGNLFGMFCFCLLGPTKLLPFLPFNLGLTVGTLICLGLTIGCGLIPTFKSLLHGAVQIGMPESFDTHGIVSGFFNSCFSLGAFLGPTVGGAIVDAFTFSWACTFVAGLFVIGAVLVLTYSLVLSRFKRSELDSVYLPIDGDIHSADIAKKKDTNVG